MSPMRRKQTDSNSTPTRGSTGFRGTWDLTGSTMYLGDKKYLVNRQGETVEMPLDDKDKKYLKSISSPELERSSSGSQNTETLGTEGTEDTEDEEEE